MVNNAEAVLREALALPDPERADLAAELLASLDEPADDDPATVSALWGEELDRRGKGRCRQRLVARTCYNDFNDGQQDQVAFLSCGGA